MRYLATAAALALGTGAANAQALLDVATLDEMDDADVVASDGTEIGDIDEILIDESGRVLAVVVKVGGFLDIGDEELVFALERLTYQNGDYVTELPPEEIQALPRYD